MIGAAHQVHSWRPKWTNTDTADPQRIALALEVQSAAAPAYDEPRSVDYDTD